MMRPRSSNSTARRCVSGLMEGAADGKALFCIRRTTAGGTVAVGAGTLNSSTVAPKARGLERHCVWPPCFPTFQSPHPRRFCPQPPAHRRTGHLQGRCDSQIPLNGQPSAAAQFHRLTENDLRGSHIPLPGRIPAASIPCRQHASSSAMAPASKRAAPVPV